MASRFILICACVLTATAVRAAPAEFDARIASAKAAMMAEPDRALAEARRARAALAGNPDPFPLAEALWLEGEALARLNKTAEARPLIDRAEALIAPRTPVRKLHGDVLRSRASLAGAEGSVGAALTDLQRAFAIYQRAGEARSQAIALNDIGAIYGEAGDSRRALRYYDQAVESFADDPALTLAIENGRGTEYKALGETARAEQAFRAALAHARELGSPVLTARILANLASVQFQGGKLALADRTAEAGLRAAASGDAAGWAPHLWGVRAQIALARGDPATAERLIARTFAGEDIARTTVDFRDFHAAAERIYAARGRPDLALAHLRALKRIDDETKAVVANAAAALASARFDFARQDLRIAQLKEGQLRRDVALARSRERLHRTTLGAALGVALAILAGVLLALRSARRGRDQVAAVNEDLRQANSSLDKALKAKSEFLATTSHEIRTPLNGILGMTEVLLHDPAMSQPQRERVALVHGAGETMKALVDDLLDVAKIETGALTLETEEVAIRQLLADVVALWTPQAEAKGVALSANLAGLPERIVGHGRQIRQIAFNLLSNAVKFTLAGAIDVTAAVVERDGGHMLVLAVRDTGIGIPEHELEPIFEPFHQVDGGTARQFGGTGLGLSICRNYSRDMGGDVTVESTLGVGSTFTLGVPVALAAAQAETAAGRGWPATLADAAVVVVEANPLKRSMIEALLGPAVRDLRVVADPAGAAAAPADLIVAPADPEASAGTAHVPMPADLMTLPAALRQAIAAGQPAPDRARAA